MGKISGIIGSLCKLPIRQAGSRNTTAPRISVSAPPPQPKIYHITHVANLKSIIADGALLSDAQMIARGGPQATIGMSSIKQRRLALPIECHPGLRVGDCVPFYFCPRSIMLYVIHRANSVELAYRGGQGSIVHLESDLHTVIAWAQQAGRRWAFSLSNAGAYYTMFRSQIGQLSDLNWPAIAASDWREQTVRECKQAEFLLEQAFPWTLVERVGVLTSGVGVQAAAAIATGRHQPRLEICHSWYY
jgi:hypothetical protein